MLYFLLFFWISSPQTSYSFIEHTDRTGRENCWIKLTFSNQKKVCLNKSAWKTWLFSSDSMYFCIKHKAALVKPGLKASHSECLDLLSIDGQWRVLAFPKNSSHSQKSFHSTYFLRASIIPSDRENLEFLSESIWMGVILHGIKNVERAREMISDFLKTNDPLGVFRKLLINESSPQSPAAVLKRLGFVHLMTATGIHLMVLSQACQTCVEFLFKMFRWPLNTGLWLGRALSFLLCFCLWVLNGSRWGMLRPSLIMVLRSCALHLGFRWNKGSPLVLALGIEALVLLLGPKVGLQSAEKGRWVYALAVGGGLMGCDFFKSIPRLVQWIGNSGATHLGLALGSWLGVVVWEIGEGSTVALATPLLSLLTLPVVCSWGFLILILSLVLLFLGFESLATQIYSVLSEGITQWLSYLSWFACQEGNVWMVSSRVLWPAAFLATLVGFLPYRRSVICLLLLMTLGFRTAIEWAPVASRTQAFGGEASGVEQLDVGQGDSALVFEDKSHRVGLIDGGSESALSDNAWIQIMAERGIRKIDWVALTHLDEDHYGGLLALGKWVRIGCVVAPDSELKTLKGIRVQEKLAMVGINLGSWFSPCIPFPHHVVERNKGKRKLSNKTMGVLWIPINEKLAYMNAGDVHEEVEAEVGAWMQAVEQKENRIFARKRILKINHHGSNSSNSMDFIKKISPTQAWISVGVSNRYGHPSPRVTEMLKRLRIPVRRTDQEGALSSEKVPLD